MDRVFWDSSSAILQAQMTENRVLEQRVVTACDGGELATPERADELLREAIETHEGVIQNLRMTREYSVGRPRKPMQRSRPKRTTVHRADESGGIVRGVFSQH